ncbi:serine hydrolase [Phocaeicola sp.]
MKKSLFILAGLLVSGTILAQHGGQGMKKYENQLPQEGRGNVHVAYQGKAIDQMVYEFMEEQGIPGMTLAIVQAPYIPRVVGYGVTDVEKGNLAAAKTLWPIGPISQGFTAVAVMQLYEKGKLELNDPIGKYLKNIPESWKSATILQLLQHSSGIADYRKQKGFSTSNAYTPDQLIEMVADLPVAFPVGTDVKQSATNFLLLTSIIEKVGKMRYTDFVKKHQIDYLGLKQTVFGEDLDKVKQEDVATTANVHQAFKRDKDYINPSETTTGYVEKEGKLAQAAAIHPASMKGFSDIWASAENVSHWDIALAGGVLIAKPENRDIIYKPTTLVNGKVVPAMAGWQFYAHKGLMDIKGNVSGHSAFLSRFTDASELVCVTLLANKEGVDMTNLGRKIAAAFDNNKLGTGADEGRLYTYESQFGVSETMNRIEETLKTMGIPVFAKFDHGKNAEEVGLTLLPNQVIVFGSPKVGTKLMQENPSISIELPLKISVWEDANGSVWVTFQQMKNLAAEYGLESEPVIGKMQELLEQIVIKSASVY